MIFAVKFRHNLPDHGGCQFQFRFFFLPHTIAKRNGKIRYLSLIHIYAKSLKNIIAFGPEKPGIDYRIHSADEFILVSGMEEAVLVYMEAIKNLLAI